MGTGPQCVGAKINQILLVSSHFLAISCYFSYLCNHRVETVSPGPSPEIVIIILLQTCRMGPLYQSFLIWSRRKNRILEFSSWDYVNCLQFNQIWELQNAARHFFPQGVIKDSESRQAMLAKTFLWHPPSLSPSDFHKVLIRKGKGNVGLRWTG